MKIQHENIFLECRTKHPMDKTPHVHFVIGGRKPPHVFLKADKTPHAQKYNMDKTRTPCRF